MIRRAAPPTNPTNTYRNDSTKYLNGSLTVVAGVVLEGGSIHENSVVTPAKVVLAFEQMVVSDVQDFETVVCP